MAIKKIPCGGWLYDDETITFENGVMKAIGGGISEAPIDGKQYARKDAEWSEVQSGGGGGMVVNFNVQVSGEEGVVSADKTPAEVIAAALTGPVMGTLISPDIGLTEITPLGSVVFINPPSPAFWVMGIKNNKMYYFISAEDDDWVVSFM